MTIGDGLTITDLAYAAALVDGEGCVGIKRSKGIRPKRGSVSPEYRVYILVANTYKPVIDWMQLKFGGSVGFRQPKQDCVDGRKRKVCYRWRLASASAVMFLRLIRPYMIIKKDQADLCFMFQESVQTKCKKRILSEETLKFREECFQKNRMLNQTGVKL